MSDTCTLSKLKRTKQCAKCPWRKDVDPNDIPHYDPEKHRELAKTIAKPGDTSGIGSPLNVMVCHETDDAHCVGWLVNQIGVGNNISLRLAMRHYPNAGKLRTIGEQHERFEDTMP